MARSRSPSSRRPSSISPSSIDAFAPSAGSPDQHTLASQMLASLVQKFKGENPDDAEHSRLADLRQRCRDGNPFPLIAAQWPELILTDPQDIAIFNTPMDPARLHSLTESVVAAVADLSNPPLRLDAWQKIIIAAYFDPTIGEIFIKGATGTGKGASVSMALCLWYDAYEDSRITLTGRDYSHAVVNIFGEVRKWFMRMKHPLAGKVLGEGINDTQRHYIRILNPDPTSPTAGEAFSGAHGPNTIYAFDEATSAADSFFDNSEKNARKIIALANPRTLLGRFRNAFTPLGNDIDRIGVVQGPLGRRLCVTIGGMDCANVRFGRLKQPVAPLGGITIDGRHFNEGDTIPPDLHARVKPLIPEQIDLGQFRGICSKPDARQVDVFAHGKFPTEDPQKQVILSSWLARHEAAWLDLQQRGTLPPAECFGFDVARSEDGDESVLAVGGQAGVTEYIRWKIADIILGVGELIRVVRERYGIDLTLGRNPVCVDCDGLGAGAFDILKSLGVWVIEFHGNATSQVDPRTYANQRAEAYGTLGRRLNPADRWGNTPWAIPTDERLRRELTAPEKVYASDFLRWRLLPKVEIKKLLNGQSPDTGDSTVYLFHAVRILFEMNAYFAAVSGPLVAWPVEESKEEREEREGREAVERRRMANGGSVPLPAGHVAAAAKNDPAAELLAYLQSEYGGGGGGELAGGGNEGGEAARRDWRNVGLDD